MSRNDKLNQFDDLIDELQRNDKRPSTPRAFKQDLRSQLLNQYDNPGFSLATLGRWAGTAVALGVLALIVVFSWNSIGRQSGAASAYIGTVDVPGRDEFIVYDQLRLEFPMWVELDPGWAEMTAESWQSLDGTFFRGEVVDAEGRQRVFAQGDGQFLWRGTYDSSVARMETVSLQYFDVYHALAQAEGWAGIRTTPPFYDDLGWGGLVQSVLRLDWNCEGAQCVNDFLVEPPLGVSSQGGEYEPYSWGVDLVGTETTGNGRSLTTYRIEYSPNQDGIAGSQYRLVKLDSDNDTVVEVADYDGDTLLRRLERVSHQLMTSADLPDGQFTLLPPGTGVSYVLPEGRTTAETQLLAAPNGEPEATLAADTPVTLSGLMANQLAVVQNGITWQYVTADGVGQGWVDEASVQWPLTSDGQLVDLDTSELPTAVPIPTQLTILRTYQTELEAILPLMPDEDLPRLEQMLASMKVEIARLEQQMSEGETAVSTPTQHDANDVWLISATQHARSSVDATVTLEITVGYQFESDEEVILKPLYANPNWESASSDRSPIDGLSEAITLTEKTGTQTITFSASPAEMRQIVGTDRPVLVMQLGYLSEGENGRRELNILAMPALTDFTIDLTRTLEMQYYQPDYTAVVSGTGGNGLTLQTEPNGRQVGVLEEGTVVTLNDEPLVEREGLVLAIYIHNNGRRLGRR
jgi:hypothetical protein